MLEYFSEIEIAHLRELKASLSLKPKDYFFHRIENFDEFRQINAQMWLWQWRYLYSGLTLIVETFKELGNALYSLLTLDFSVAGEHFYKTPKAALAALAKLTLDIGLLCLHLTRLTTLLIATFSPQVTLSPRVTGSLGISLAAFSMASLPSYPVLGTAGLVVGMGVYCMCLGHLIQSLIRAESENNKRKQQRANKLQDINDFIRLLEQIGLERQQINQTLKDFQLSKRPSLQTSPGNEQGFFSNSAKLPKEYQRQQLETEEFVAQFFLALDSYPDFSPERVVSEPGYVNQIYKEHAEHHAAVLVLAAELFSRLDNARAQRMRLSENDNTESGLSYK
ncbi:TPA: hypothetical protein ACPSKB_000958 [Legionella feeleii]